MIDMGQVRVAIQVGLLTNVPAAVRVICVSLAEGQMRMSAYLEREPSDDEKEALLDACLDAAAQFDEDVDVALECVVDGRPMTALMSELHGGGRGAMVYARYERDYA